MKWLLQKKDQETVFVCEVRSPPAEYCMAVTATPSCGCSLISISEEASRKILKVPLLYPADTRALSLLQEGLQHTHPQAWQERKEKIIDLEPSQCVGLLL